MSSPEFYESREYSPLEKYQNEINRQHEGELRANLKKLENKIIQDYPGLLPHLYKNHQYMNYQSNASIGYEELQTSDLSTFDKNLPGQGEPITEQINGTSETGTQIVSKFGMKYKVFDNMQCNKVYIGFDLPGKIRYPGIGKNKGKQMSVSIDPNTSDDPIRKLIASKTILHHYESSKYHGVSTNPFMIYHPKNTSKDTSIA